jgi:4-hydroxy-tetrahydrodipicolinate reductase
MTITKGMACGVEQIGRGYIGRKQVVKLHFRAAVGEKESYDTVKITGNPPIESTIKDGVNGDIATCAITVNAARTISRLSPGLKSMLDLPVLEH